MNHRRNFTTLLSACTLALALAAGGALAQGREIKIALDGPADLEKVGTYVWANTFGKQLQAGGMAVKEFARGSIGEEAERLDQVSQGLLEVSMSDLKAAGGLDSLAFGLMLPYLLADDAQMDHALQQGGMLERINAGTTKKGVRVLAVALIGPPAGIFNTKKPVASVADMAGLRMRALDKNQVDLFQAWGAAGTIVAWPEVANALQTGVADGYLNPPVVPLMFGHAGIIKHFTDARVAPSVRLAIASEDWYRKLSAEQRKLVDAAVAKATAANRAWLKTRDKELQDLEKAGMKVTGLSPAARAEFQKRSEPLYTSGVLSPDQVAAWKKAAGQ